MRIGINTRFLLSHKMEGFGWFTFEIVKRMVLAHPEDQFYFFFDRQFDEKFLFAKNVIPIVLSPQARHPILFKIWFDWSITKALKKYEIDTFFSPDGYLSLRSNVPQLGVIHDLNFEHYPNDIPKWPRHYLKKHFPIFAKHAAHIITVSEYSKQDIVDKYKVDPSKITVAYNAAGDIFKEQSDSVKNQIKENYTQGEDYFIYVGAIHKRKNVDRLIESFLLFKKATQSRTKLVIVGDPLWNGEGEKKNQDEIIYTGHIGFDELARLVGSALTLCLVSYFEGFGIPLVEAMQSGVPVLSGNLTSLPEVCGEAGHLVDPFDIEDIKNGFIKLDSDPLYRNELIKKGLSRSNDFSWTRSSEIIWDQLIILSK